jgi:predicted esterase
MRLFYFFIILFYFNSSSSQTISKVALEGLSYSEIQKKITSTKFLKPGNKGLIKQTILCLDTVERPYYVYIPKDYDENTATPLLVYLHGGVARKELVDSSDFIKYLNETPWLKEADNNNFICLFPMGEYAAMWWSEVGAANVLAQIRNVKTNFNIDDNKCYLTGFSDGASATYFMAMSHPTDFASFTPLNGFPGVGSFTFSSETFFQNLSNNSLNCINTDEDGLYPAHKIQKQIELAQNAGANIMYRIYSGIGHRFTYLDKESGNIINFFKNNTRNPLPTNLVWETAKKEQGRINWLEINLIDSTIQKQEWHKDYNMKMTDERVTFGFRTDRKYKGDGIRIDKISGKKYLCGKLGMLDGDVILKINTTKVDSSTKMSVLKKNIHRGDSISFSVLRNEKEMLFKGKLDDIKEYDLFTRKQKSGQIRAHFIANTFHVEASRIKSFSIYVHPEMVQLSQPLKIIVNGKEVFNKKVIMDLDFLLKNYSKHKDKSLLYVCKVDIDL